MLSDSSADVHTTGTTAFYRPAGSGSFDVTASSTDGQSGILDYGFPVLAGFTGSGAGATRTYTLATPTEPNGAKPVTARNPALLSSTATNFTLTSDSAGPTGGALTVNGTVATGGGSRQLRRRRQHHDRPAHRLQRRRRLRHQHLDPHTRGRHAQRRRLLGLRRPDDPRRHPGPERPRHRLLPLHAHRHRQRRQHQHDHHGRQGRYSPTRPPPAWCSPTRAPTSTPPAPPPSTAPPAPAPSTSPPARPTASPGSPPTPSRPSPASPLSGSRRRAHLHPRDPDRAQRRQDRHREQQRRPHQQLHLHPHRRLGGSRRRRLDGERRRGERRRFAELRQRRHLHDRPPHRLHRRDLRPRNIDADARGRHAQRGRLLGLRRPGARSSAPPPRTGSRPAATATSSPAPTASATPSRSRRSSRSTRARPAAPGLVLADSSADVHTTGTTAFYRPAGSGSFDVTASSTDGAVRDPRLQLPRPRRLHRLRRRRHPHLHPRHPDRAQRRQDRERAQQRPVCTAGSTFTLTSDSAGPTGGALTVNGAAASGGGTQSYDGDGSFPIDARTNYNADALSGFATSVLTREDGTLAGDACSSYGAPDDDRRHAGPERARDRLLPLRPHRHRQRRQHRRRSRRSSRSTPARRPRPAWCSPTPAPRCTPPAPPPSTGPPAAAPSTSPPRSTDGQSGILDYSFPALAGFTGSGAGATRTYTLATPTEPNGTKPVTARNPALLNSTATNFTLTSDAAAPTGGALTVNGVAASRRRHAELRRRRRLHDRPPHRLRRRRSPASPPRR